LRDAFSHVAMKEQDVRLDLAGVTYADPEFLGVLLVLYRHQHRIGRRFSCSAVSARLHRIVRLSYMSFVLEPAPGSTQPAQPPHPLES
jgi:anti-anti-sigma regulatory factor